MKVKLKKTREKVDFVMDKQYQMTYDKNYIPMGYVTIEGEIKDKCNKQRIVVQKITEGRVFFILGRKVRSKKDCVLLQDFIDKQNNEV